MPKKYHRRSKIVLDVAKQRIKKLIQQAEDIFDEEKALADRYVYLARRIAMKYKIRITPSLQKRFCKHCYSFLMPGKNLRVRTTQGKMTYSCLECKKFMRFPLRK
ncbi:ribonuclease P [Candidatus Woesearchaeota archaeon]|nr:ribonuclease P [Candidatus Woesearchaeota archaeon]